MLWLLSCGRGGVEAFSDVEGCEVAKVVLVAVSSSLRTINCLPCFGRGSPVVISFSLFRGRTDLDISLLFVVSGIPGGDRVWFLLTSLFALIFPLIRILLLSSLQLLQGLATAAHVCVLVLWWGKGVLVALGDVGGCEGRLSRGAKGRWDRYGWAGFGCCIESRGAEIVVIREGSGSFLLGVVACSVVCSFPSWRWAWFLKSDMGETWMRAGLVVF